MSYNVIHFKEIDSTNSYLKNTYKLLDNFTFASADYQSKGKGRENRVWESEPGENLMFSLLIKDKKLIEVSSYLSIYTAVIIAEVLEAYEVKNVSIKWPNDVIINDKKVCGILLEGQVPEYVVIGCGLNVNQKVFPDGLRRPATSVSLELNEDIVLDEFKEIIFDKFDFDLNSGKYSRKHADYLDYFRKHNYLLNKRVRVVINEQTFIGHVVGIDDDLCLQILTRDMLLHVDSGEIEIIG